MARYTEAVCRYCRRDNTKLFLKGERCYTDKRAIDRRGYPPGQHGHLRRKFSDYGTQLREKQKVKRIYGVLEKQFRIYFQTAFRKKGITGENLLFLLECRLDNVVYRLGFANSRSQARHWVRHGHFVVNGHRVNIPSAMVKEGDLISVQEGSRKIGQLSEAMEAVARRTIPSWLELEPKDFSGKVLATPSREELTMPMQEQLVVELYSK